MTLQVTDIRFAHHQAGTDVLSGGDSTPSLSWRIVGAPEEWTQARAQIEVTPVGGDSVVHELEGSEGTRSVAVAWPGQPLDSRQEATVRIRVADADGDWSDWSEPRSYACGLLHNADWNAVPVTPGATVRREDPAPVLVRRFTVGTGVDHGRLHITAGGVFVAYVDGHRIGRDQLAPGWTEYGKRIAAFTYDVTELLAPGEHELAVVLGNGWYRGKLTWGCRTNVYGDALWLLAELGWHDADGDHTIGTDNGWRWLSSNILSNDLYDGQCADTRLPLLGEGEGAAVETMAMPRAAIVPAEAPAARIIDVLPAREVIVTPSGKHILDFGQNIAGWVRAVVHGADAGDRLVLRHAEVLEHGELGTRPLRNAKATDEFILDGTDGQTVEPLFTQHGFRYVEVEGLGQVRPEDFQALVVSADMESLADFECSDEDVNRLFANARWSAIDNFLTVPTDCPQRDERLGWTGDIAVFAPTATSLFDAAAFLSSWLEDMAADQGADGGIPVVVPDVLDGPKLTCGWGDAAVLVPWAIYETTGDVGVLRRFLAMMDAFVDGVDRLAGDNHLWQGGFQFGDWLDPDAPVDDPGKSKADPDIVATAYFAHSARLVAQAHEAVGDGEGAARYGALADAVAQAFRDEYVTANGAILSDCASVYAMAIAWDLLDTDAQRNGAGRRLADIIRVSGYRISTGFLGTPLVCEALEKSGAGAVAMRLLLQRRCPSWLYPVSMGATTIWERWDSMLPNGDINPGEMTSFNHYALGAIAHWLITGVAGLKATSPAWRTVLVKPVVGSGLSHAKARQRTPYGDVEVSWRLDGDALDLELALPAGVTAEVRLPGAAPVHDVVSRRVWHVEGMGKTIGATTGRVCDSMTVRDVIDDPMLMDGLTQVLAECGSPVYAGPDPDVTFAKTARQWLDAPVDRIPDIAANQGYVPGADAIVAAAQAFLDRSR